MKVDLYTKVILTVIALCLTLLVLRDIRNIPEALAQAHIGDDVVKVQIVSIAESLNHRWEPLPVKIVR